MENRWICWTTRIGGGLLLALVLYPLSYGPLIHLAARAEKAGDKSRYQRLEELAEAVYWPLSFVYYGAPIQVQAAMDWYIQLWVPSE